MDGSGENVDIDNDNIYLRICGAGSSGFYDVNTSSQSQLVVIVTNKNNETE